WAGRRRGRVRHRRWRGALGRGAGGGVDILGGRPGPGLRVWAVEAGDDAGEGGLQPTVLLYLGEDLSDEAARGLRLAAVDEQPIGRAGRHDRLPSDRIDVHGGLQVGRDAPGAQGIEQILA